MWGQVVDTKGSSALSMVGLGDISSRSLTRINSMGGAGIASNDYYYINNLNVATSPYHQMVNFDIGASNTTRMTGNQATSRTNLDNINFLFPLNKKLATVAGYNQLTNVRYNIVTTETVIGRPDESAIVNYFGSGGLTAASVGFGYMAHRYFSIGYKGSYVFGLIEDQTLVIPSFGQTFSEVQKTETFQRFLDHEISVFYKNPITRTNVVALGATYSFNNRLEYNRNRIDEAWFNSSSQPVRKDTISTAELNRQLPRNFRVGVSYIKKRDSAAIINLWNVNLDLEFSDYSNTTDRALDGDPTQLLGVRAGFEYSPLAKFIGNASSMSKLKSFFVLSQYRIGAYFTRGPYEIQGETYSDMGVSMGLGLPLGKVEGLKQFSSINIGLTYGQRGVAIFNENYFRLNIGFAINNNWFVRPKIN